MKKKQRRHIAKLFAMRMKKVSLLRGWNAWKAMREERLRTHSGCAQLRYHKRHKCTSTADATPPPELSQIWTRSSPWCRQSSTSLPTPTRWRRHAVALGPATPMQTPRLSLHDPPIRAFRASQKFQKHVNKPAAQSAGDKLKRKMEYNERKRARLDPDSRRVRRRPVPPAGLPPPLCPRR